ncbi:MAG: SNF2-related protein, partial [Selenomonadaceae bacterium]|nr:SNF2-related protein [Selenomonadaceae bacterium]
MKLRPYQAYACQQIIEKPACALFLDMGLGKTLSTLSAIDELVNNRLEVARVLVIAPLRVAETTWPDEVRKWGFDLTVSVVTGKKADRE